MADQDDGSVTRWTGDVNAGGDSGARHLWGRSLRRLMHLARTRLSTDALAPVLNVWLEGYRGVEIAQRLGYAEPTVKCELKAIRKASSEENRDGPLDVAHSGRPHAAA
jgi:hypothetical protein